MLLCLAMIAPYAVSSAQDETCLLQVGSHVQAGTKRSGSQAESVANQGAISPTQNTEQTLEEIFKKSGTDKLWRHGYHRYYETELAPYRHIKDARILEIGADSGISLGAWMSYFSSPAAVHGIAYGVDEKVAKDKACSLMPESCDKLALFSMDQSDVHALDGLAEKNPEGWDIIIDDGSHKPQHQLISFQRLWPKIRPGGLYALEDIETSYVDDGTRIYGYDLNGGIAADPPTNAVEQFKRLVDVVNRKHFDQPDFTVFAGTDHDVAKVSFADGLIFVQKKPATEGWDKYPTMLFATKANSGRTFAEYKAKVEPVNKWFENLSAEKSSA